MQNRNNFKIGLGNYLQSKLVLITCYKICYNMKTLENYIILFIFIAREKEMKKRELRNEKDIYI